MSDSGCSIPVLLASAARSGFQQFTIQTVPSCCSSMATSMWEMAQPDPASKARNCSFHCILIQNTTAAILPPGHQLLPWMLDRASSAALLPSLLQWYPILKLSINPQSQAEGSRGVEAAHPPKQALSGPCKPERVTACLPSELLKAAPSHQALWLPSAWGTGLQGKNRAGCLL